MMYCTVYSKINSSVKKNPLITGHCAIYYCRAAPGIDRVSALYPEDILGIPVPGDVGARQIVYVEPVVLDTVDCVPQKKSKMFFNFF